MVPVLFARKDSVYKTLGADVYDIDRDARTWPGGCAGVYHPPCRAWGRLKGFAKPRPDEKELARWSVRKIREFGGVLEHPDASSLWKDMNLPMGGRDEYGGFTLRVDQSWWGHRARKKTLLYICGCEPKDVPSMPIKFDAIEYTVGTSITYNNKRRGFRPSIKKSEREATPEPFAKWLIELAKICNKINH